MLFPIIIHCSTNIELTAIEVFTVLTLTVQFTDGTGVFAAFLLFRLGGCRCSNDSSLSLEDVGPTTNVLHVQDSSAKCITMLH